MALFLKMDDCTNGRKYMLSAFRASLVFWRSVAVLVDFSLEIAQNVLHGVNRARIAAAMAGAMPHATMLVFTALYNWFTNVS